MLKKDFNLFKGDSQKISLKITVDNGIYKPSGSDTVFFTIKPSYSEEKVLQKKYPDNGITYDEESQSFIISLVAGDTENLSPQYYVYDIKVTMTSSTGIIRKTVAYGMINIMNEVTLLSDETN